MTQDLLDDIVRHVSAPASFSATSFDVQITKNIEQYRNFVNASAVLYHIADETDSLIESFLSTKRSFERVMKERPIFEDVKGGKIEIPFNMEFGVPESETMIVEEGAEEIIVPSEEWAGFTNSTLTIKGTELPDFVIKAIFAKNESELHKNIEYLQNKEIMREKIIQCCKENKLDWILHELAK